MRLAALPGRGRSSISLGSGTEAGSPLSFDLLRPAEEPVWPKGKLEILKALEALSAAGDQGFEEIRPELLRIEALRENEPRQAIAASWKLLKEVREPGAAVGLLAVIARGAPRSQAHHLLTLAAEILGPNLSCAAGGKLSTVVGRYYTKAGFPRDAISVRQLPGLTTGANFKV